MRARMALAYAKINYQHREILLKNKPQSMLNYSAKGTVPVLIEKATVIDESLDVMRWALSHNDMDNWLLKDKANRQDEMFELIRICDEKFKQQLDRYKYSDRYPLTEIEYRDQSQWFLKLLNERLSHHQFLISNQMCMADIAIFPFIRQYAYVNKKWFDNTSYTYLNKWLDYWLNSKLFLSIMQKHSLWEDI